VKSTLLLILALSGCVAARSTALTSAVGNAPARWEVPTGWKQESFPFPVDFAPDLPHHGIEVLRFAPGFFDPAQPGYWSYAWVWWLEDPTVPGRTQLEDELARYFRGLSQAVGEKKYGPFDPARFHARLEEAPAPPPGWTGYRGDVQSVDAFATGQPITLQVRIRAGSCPRANRRAVLVAASPQTSGAPIWGQLETLLDSFPCE
jgi:hypothetical protein